MHPVVALGLALAARGHKATIITNPFFQELIEAQGLGFLPLGTLEDARAAIADPDLWHPRKGFEVVARRAILPAMAETYKHIERHAGPRTVVVASGIAFGARLAQERLGVPTATIHLQPSIIRSLVEQGMAGNIRISASQPMWFKRGFFRLADWLVIDRVLKAPLNQLRATLNLPPVDRVMYRWLHSPQLVIGFFPEWFAPAQPDWPPHTHLVGFPLWDTGRPGVLPPDAREFLAAGAPPVIFTPGSATATLHAYFRESVAAARELGAARDARHELPRSGSQGTSAAREGLRISAIQRSAASCGDARVSRWHRHAGTDDQGGHPASRRAQRPRSVRQRLPHRRARPGPQHPADRVSCARGRQGDSRHPRRQHAPHAMPRPCAAHRFGRRADTRVRAYRIAGPGFVTNGRAGCYLTAV